MSGPEAPAQCLAGLLQRLATSRGSDARRAMLLAADQAPSTQVSIDDAEDSADTAGGPVQLRKPTVRVHKRLRAKRKELKLLPVLMELHEHFVSFSACQSAPRKRSPLRGASERQDLRSSIEAREARRSVIR